MTNKAVAVAAIVLASRAVGQPCVGAWSDEFPSSEMPEGVWTLQVLDADGAGPDPGVLASGMGFYANIHFWSGGAWLPSDPPPSTGHIHNIAELDPDGPGGEPPSIYVSGDISSPSRYIRRFNRTLRIWETITGRSGLTNEPLYLATLDEDGPGPKAPALFVCGVRWVDQLLVNGLARYDGNEWSEVGGGVDTGEIWDLATFDDDGPGPRGTALYAAGRFQLAGTTPASNIARWDGQSWSPLGTGIGDNRVFALVVFDEDGTGPEEPALFAAGSIISAGGVGVRNIAKWDGTTWSDVGGGTDSAILDLIVFDEDDSGPKPPALFALGTFTEAGGTPTNYIARWDGTSWTDVGGGVSYTAHTGAVYDLDGDGPRPPSLYVGGEFEEAGGVGSRYVAEWDGVEWSVPGDGGMNDTVYAIETFDPDASGPLPRRLYVGGAFTQPVRFIARRDETTWNSLGGEPNGTVRALLAVEREESVSVVNGLYVGGEFLAIGGQPANNIARWSGSEWTPLGSGMNGRVDALALFDAADGPGSQLPRLYAGGTFTSAGGSPAAYVAFWDGDNWHPAGTGLPEPVQALTVYDGALYAAASTALLDVFVWDGTDWASLPGNFHNYVRALAVVPGDNANDPDPGTLVAGGVFGAVGSQITGRVVSWDPRARAWTKVGDGISGGTVHALAVLDRDGPGGMPADLYAAGTELSYSGYPSARGLLRLNGGIWEEVGGGLNGTARTMLAQGGDLYIGGDFTMAGPVSSAVSSSRLARWRCLCYADCDQSTGAGVLDIFDFLCFQNSFVSGEPYACECEPDPVCDIFDFLCFQSAFVAGCP